MVGTARCRTDGEFVDLTGELHGMMFEPLSNTSMFASAHFDDELGAVAWDNGADLAPEFLRNRVKVRQ